MKENEVCLYCFSLNTKFDPIKRIVKCKKCGKKYRMESYFFGNIEIFYPVLLDKTKDHKVYK